MPQTKRGVEFTLRQLKQSMKVSHRELHSSWLSRSYLVLAGRSIFLLAQRALAPAPMPASERAPLLRGYQRSDQFVAPIDALTRDLVST